MIRTLAILAIVASVQAFNFWGSDSNDLWDAGLLKKFDPMFGFNELSMTVTDVKSQGYTQVENPETSGFGALDLFIKIDKNKCTSTSVIGLYFDESGPAGLRVSIPKDKVTAHFDMVEQGFTPWTHDSVEYWSINMFFVSEDKETRINAVNKDGKFEVIRDEFVTVNGVNGVMDKIPATADKIAVHPDWEKEACVIMMGRHYYNKMKPDLTCDKAFHPFFPLYDEKTNQIIGMGLMVIGKCHCDLEEPDLAAVKMIVPTAPQCLYDLVEKIGVCTLHTYFINHPRLISC